MKNDIPLCVDLDGTLIRSDSLHESFIKALKVEPIKAITSLGLLFKGKSLFKNAIAKLVDLDVENLPYNPEVLDYIKEQRASREVILVTGANELIAEQVSTHLGLFSSVMASDKNTNLIGDNKRLALESRFGKQGFDYIGNETSDKVVWASARHASVVSASDKFTQEVESEFTTEKVFKTQPSTVKSWIKLLRIHQWSKNLLIFIPFLLDHRVSGWSNLPLTCLAFLAFSLLASLTYIINDMLDIESDRKNSSKNVRPLASGAIRVNQGIACIFLLGFLVLLASFFLPLQVNLAFSLYTVLTLLYSFTIKKKVMLDVCILAILHTIRVVIGTLVLGAQWSFWLLAFSMFFFLSLALAKRVSELLIIVKEHKYAPDARGYMTSDIPILSGAGISSGYISILVVALYINSTKVSSIYNVPEILWLICPPLLYWIGRLWIVTARGEMNEDPIIFAFGDRPSIYTLVCVAIVFALAVLA